MLCAHVARVCGGGEGGEAGATEAGQAAARQTFADTHAAIHCCKCKSCDELTRDNLWVIIFLYSKTVREREKRGGKQERERERLSGVEWMLLNWQTNLTYCLPQSLFHGRLPGIVLATRLLWAAYPIFPFCGMTRNHFWKFTCTFHSAAVGWRSWTLSLWLKYFMFFMFVHKVWRVYWFHAISFHINVNRCVPRDLNSYIYLSFKLGQIS